MPLPVKLATGDTAEAVSFSPNILSVISPKPFAPGTPTEFEVDGLPLQAKSLGSRRREDTRYNVRFRLINLTRQSRAHLQQLPSE